MKNDSLRPKATVAGAQKLKQNGGLGLGPQQALRLHVTSRILIGLTVVTVRHPGNLEAARDAIEGGARRRGHSSRKAALQIQLPGSGRTSPKCNQEQSART